MMSWTEVVPAVVLRLEFTFFGVGGGVCKGVWGIDVTGVAAEPDAGVSAGAFGVRRNRLKAIF